MKFKVKDMDIATGGVAVAILNIKDAQSLDLHSEDRIRLRLGKKEKVAVIDIAESAKAVPVGKIGFFEELLDALGAKNGDFVELSFEEKPESIKHIKKKLDGGTLNLEEIDHIVSDIVQNKITDVELTYFVSGVYTKGMTMKETVYLTRAMIKSGSVLEIKKRPVVELHSIGGVPGNRTTMIVVPILVAAGLTVPKTSSRAITSPSGTADTVEVLAPVSIPIARLKKIVDSVGGFMVWGGAVNLAPADDKIINIEHPLSIDPEPQLLASIMAKQGSVSASHVVIEIPIGPGSKIKDKKEAKRLEKQFEKIGRELHMKVKVVVTSGTEPVGRGIGPVLECRDVMWVLTNDPRGPSDLRERSIQLATTALKMVGKRNPRKLALKLLKTGKAYQKFFEIVKAQGGKEVSWADLPIAKYSYDVIADRNGKVKTIINSMLTKIARLAGAPQDKSSGIYIYKHVGDNLIKGEKIFTIYAESEQKLQFALNVLKQGNPFTSG